MDQIERPKTTNPSVTITSLPPELIIAILELYRFQDRFQTLNAVSLVGKGLTAPAQSLLWRSVNIEREEEARSIISSPVFGRYATEAAEVFGHSGGCLESFTLTELLAGRRGLRRLDLSQLVNSEQEINPSLLALPSLASLRELKLYRVHFAVAWPILRPSFSLHTLTIYDISSDDPILLYPRRRYFSRRSDP